MRRCTKCDKGDSSVDTVLNRYHNFISRDDAPFDDVSVALSSSKPSHSRRRKKNNSSSSCVDQYASRARKAWMNSLASVESDVRNELMSTYANKKSIAARIANENCWSDIVDEMESSVEAKNDFITLLRMLEDKGVKINGAAIKKIAKDVAYNHSRRLTIPQIDDNGHELIPHSDEYSCNRNVYANLKAGIDHIEDSNLHLKCETAALSSKKQTLETNLYTEMKQRNEEISSSYRDLKLEKLKMQQELDKLRARNEQLEYDVKIANELAETHMRKSRESETATKKELETLDGGIRDLEQELARLTKENAILKEERQAASSHNDSLLKEVERQDIMLRKLSREADTHAALARDTSPVVEHLFAIVRALKERLDEYDICKDRLVNNVNDIRQDRDYVYRVGELGVEVSTARLYRVLEQVTDNNGRLHNHIETLQDMARHLDRSVTRTTTSHIP